MIDMCGVEVLKVLVLVIVACHHMTSCHVDAASTIVLRCCVCIYQSQTVQLPLPAQPVFLRVTFPWRHVHGVVYRGMAAVGAVPAAEAARHPHIML